MFEGYPRGPLASGVYRDPRVRQFPRLLQFKHQNAQDANAFTLDATPQYGSVLIAGVNSQLGQALPTISGGGATWDLLGYENDNGTGDGAQVMAVLWIGRVTGTPSTSVSMGFSNAGSMFVGEWAGLYGQVVGVKKTKAFQTALDGGVLAGLPGGLGIWHYASRHSLHGYGWDGVADTLMHRVNNTRGVFASRVHPGGRHPVSTSSGGSNHILIGALVR